MDKLNFNALLPLLYKGLHGAKSADARASARAACVELCHVLGVEDWADLVNEHMLTDYRQAMVAAGQVRSTLVLSMHDPLGTCNILSSTK